MSALIGTEILDAAGLNLVAVFDLAGLPAAMRAALEVAVPGGLAPYRQAVLVGHGGRALWQALERGGGIAGDDPVDTFSRAAVSQWLEGDGRCREFAFLYPPADAPAPLMALGALAGWHHTSPLGIGVGARFGTWFAYRALVLADSDFEPTPRASGPSPCDACESKPCVKACPVGAVSPEGFMAERCFSKRLEPGSGCAERCAARLACPVVAEARYGEAQVRYHYRRSLATLQAYAGNGEGEA